MHHITWLRLSNLLLGICYLLALSACPGSGSRTIKHQKISAATTGSDLSSKNSIRNEQDGARLCAGAGGICQAVGDCGPGHGHISDLDCQQGAHLVCCIPEKKCSGPENFVCCSDTATFRPVCAHGQLVCLPPLKKAPTDKCPGNAAHRKINSTSSGS